MTPERLFELLPAIYRIRDAEHGGPLEALLRVIGEQVNVVEDDIARLYDNWFIETCDDWVVPYIGALVGYRPVPDSGQPGDVRTARGRARNRVLVPRREVANTIRYRRRKGTLALLELLARDVAGWPARAVEFYRLLTWNQALNHQHLDRARTVDVRRGSVLDLAGGPFDEVAHTVDVRRVNSRRTAGRHNIPSVGVFIWRLEAYPVTETPACCVESAGPHCFTFSVLGNDAPTFVHAEPEADPTEIAGELNLPVPIRRRLLAEQRDRIYGPSRSLFIWTGAKRGRAVTIEPVAPERIVAADLSGWRYLPRRGTVAVDPVLGRIAFPTQHAPKNGVWVSYRYGFSADLGGGEYDRPIAEPAGATVYRVSQDGALDTIAKALAEWHTDQPADAVIEIDDSRVYVEPVHVEFGAAHRSLQLRAANCRRPVIRLLDWQTSQPDALTVTGRERSRFVLDGLMVTGRGVQVGGDLARVTIRHSTLVPGWGLGGDCEPERASEPSLEVFSPDVCVTIEHSIVGAIQINPISPASGEEAPPPTAAPESEVQQARCAGIGPGGRLDPIRLCISDSIVDATDSDLEAIGAPGCPVGHAALTIARATVVGRVQVHAIELGENCIFDGVVAVARRQHGCLRFSYVTPGSRTPKRFHCQPDLAEQAAVEALRAEAAAASQPAPTPAVLDAARASERIRVRPQMNGRRYGQPTYCQLAAACAPEIVRGADDESEMGVFHDLFQPEREANLRARLNEYVPAGADVGVILAS
jgi:hypothetical protein